MTQLVPVVYVGNKPEAYDNIARSGKTWAGKGDIQEVTEAQAKLLVKFPDQWQLADATDVERVETPTSITATDTDGQEVAVDPEVFKQPIEKMTKVELVAYAKDKFGKDLDVNKGKKLLLDQIEEWERDLDTVINAPA